MKTKKLGSEKRLRNQINGSKALKTKETATTRRKKPCSTPGLAKRATAYHEAGHAVACIVREIYLQKVTIVRGKNHLGACIHNGVCGHTFANAADRNDIVEDIIVTLYAGMPAQRLIDKAPEQFHGENDDEAARKMLNELTVVQGSIRLRDVDSQERFLERLRAEASTLVEDHSKDIQLLAEKLLKRKTMTGDEVREWAKSNGLQSRK